ncbi:hypothetical protein BRADI_2g58878v3 [Brachypodium distachyon]|uniref:RING-type domain-containing protein n=1 Tax=Brachypodium distachyon TaxID=15368 RepID=A0A0Q3IZV4_BRADI|nr:hypothetical protein BRADI_2g58878v3 [Brachypodium distachyon]
MDMRQTVQANQVGGSGVGSAANEPLQDQQMLDVTDLDAEEPQLETLRDNTRQKIWTTTIQPHVQSAMIELNRMWAFSTINGTTVPTLGITRGPLSSAAMDPLNAYMGTSLPAKFSCPICHGELVIASSTLCGHIFCLECVKTAVKLQRKCPTCRTSLPMDGYHRIYLPD